MKMIIRIIATSLAVLIIATLLPSVHLTNGIGSALGVALVLGILRIFIRPLMIFFTLPLTIVSLGGFLLVINALIILMADHLLEGFAVNGFFTALLFSILLSGLQSVLYIFLKEPTNKRIEN